MRLKRNAIAALAALTGLTPAAAQPEPRRHHPEVLLDAAKAYALALRETCLPAVREGRPVAELAGAADAIPVDPKIATASPADVLGAWRVVSLSPVYIVAWRDGSCQVAADRGDPRAYDAAARAVLAGGPQPMHPMLLGAERRPAFCEGGAHHPLVATLRLATAKGERPASSTVWRWHGDEALPECAAEASAAP